MDRSSERSAVFSLIREAMPTVARMVGDRRQTMGAAHVTECQRRGMAGEPGWFYAWEAGVAVGTPWPEALALLAQVDPKNAAPSKAVVVLRPVEG